MELRLHYSEIGCKVVFLNYVLVESGATQAIDKEMAYCRAQPSDGPLYDITEFVIVHHYAILVVVVEVISEDVKKFEIQDKVTCDVQNFANVDR